MLGVVNTTITTATDMVSNCLEGIFSQQRGRINFASFSFTFSALIPPIPDDTIYWSSLLFDITKPVLLSEQQYDFYDALLVWSIRNSVDFYCRKTERLRSRITNANPACATYGGAPSITRISHSSHANATGCHAATAAFIH